MPVNFINRFALPLLVGSVCHGFALRGEEVKQGADLLKVDLLCVLAHPDDETGMAPAIARYALGEGKTIAHVYCTRGEGGGNMVGTQWGPSLGILREAELRDCLKAIGIRYCFFLDQLDWAYTESLAATLRNWEREAALERLVRYIRALRPDVILTMNPAPNPGSHGHHQAAGVLATEAFTLAADANQFPDQIKKEGLSVWQARKLYFSGSSGDTIATISSTEKVVDGKTAAQIAGEALSNHRSQAFGGFSRSAWFQRPRTFTLVRSVVPFVAGEDDFFRGLPIEDDTLELQRPASFPVEGAMSLAFFPRPAIRHYQSWVREQAIQHVAMDFKPDLSVVMGERSEVRFAIRNRGPSQKTAVMFELPSGWTVNPNVVECDLASNSVFEGVIAVVAPESSREDVELKAVVDTSKGEIEEVALLHPVPRMTVARVDQNPSLNLERFSQIPVHRITGAHRVQGRSTNELDSSADFRVAHDTKRLLVEVSVKDDRLVSNIAPNDIRGHWRSDSVEICVDPRAGAEDTMGCYKIGIFPFDSTGVVRAARDADARQGPIEETAPGTVLYSERIEGGYKVRAEIPFSEIGIEARKGSRLGFNIIIYDGDKEGAAMGENINESRLAWSPRRGVQGRPEDWGRIVLE